MPSTLTQTDPRWAAAMAEGRLRASRPPSAPVSGGSAAAAAARIAAHQEALFAHAAVESLRLRDPLSSAATLATDDQKFVAASMILCLACAFAAAPLTVLVGLNAAVCVYFLIVIAFRVYLAVSQIGARAGAAPRPIADEDLPSVTILLPLFNEGEALEVLAKAIAKIDYPTEKLDVKLLLEADDFATLASARRLGLDARFHILKLPNAAPRTKPKACNFGLFQARGELIVIYDAEDLPEADQLRKAAAVFASAPRDVACVQARLNYYNARENWLTRLFALEYALWFDSLLPALERIRAPIPLGGTSNIFRTDVLRAIGAWDPFNVTEDADVGMRLARYGYRTAMVDSTTFEEANSRLGNWTRQRSRWMKGYMQTWLVHMREPGAFVKAAGPQALLSMHLFLAGTVFSALVTPVLIIGAVVWALAAPPDAPAPPQPLVALNLFTLIAGNAVFIALAMIAPLKRGWTELCPYALLAPVYWALTTVAAYKALFQLFTRPHYWEKTDHILSDEAEAARALTLGRLGRT